MSDAHDHDHAHAHEGFDVKVEETGPCIAKVSFTISADEFKKTRGQGLKNVARNTRMKGFRPGKAPLAVLEKQYGKEIDRETLQHFLNHAYERAVKENELRPAAHPRVDLDTIEIEPGADVSHEFELWLRPSVELGSYKGLTIQGQSTAVNDEELEQAMEEVRRQNSRIEEADGGLEADGAAVCKVVFDVEGIDEPIFEREGLRISPKSAPAGVDAEAFEKGMTGAEKGDTKEFELEVPEGFPNESAQGKKGVCRVTVDQVFRIVPPTDEELFEGFGVEDSEGLRAEVKKRFQAAKENSERQRIENALLERLIEEHPMELPEPLLVAQAEDKVEEMRISLIEQGFQPEEIETRLEEERESTFANSSRAMRAVYLMEEVAKAEEITVGREDFDAELADIAARNQSDPEQVRKYYQEEGLGQQLAMELLERKVRSFLYESADIQVVE